MGLLEKIIFGKISTPSVQEERRYSDKISDYAEEVFKRLEIRPGDHMHNSYAAGVIDKYKESLPSVEEVLSRVDVKSRRNNDGWIFNSIKKHGPGKVLKVLENGTPLEDVDMACRFSEELDIARKTGGDAKKYRLEFYGWVQDVGFRGTVHSYADYFGFNCIKAENMQDGSVEAIVEGTYPLIDLCIKGLREDFKVTKVQKEPMPLES